MVLALIYTLDYLVELAVPYGAGFQNPKYQFLLLNFIKLIPFGGK
jgi:hypothetical protein